MLFSEFYTGFERPVLKKAVVAKPAEGKVEDEVELVVRGERDDEVDLDVER
jgi:hypothetical protein